MRHCTGTSTARAPTATTQSPGPPCSWTRRAPAAIPPPAAASTATARLAGMAVSLIAVGLAGDRIGRRRAYAGLLLVMGVAGTVFAVTRSLPFLVLAALTGTLSTDPNESGPITSLEQAMMGGAPPA